MSISGEAVEAAADIVLRMIMDRPLERANPLERELALRQGRLILEGAAPHLMAAAWDECEAAKYEIRLNPEANAWEPMKDNPYRKAPK